MLSLMVIGEVVRGEPFLFIMSLHLHRVRPILDVGALGVVWGVAAAGEGFADGGGAFFLPFLATWAHVDRAGVDATGGGKLRVRYNQSQRKNHTKFFAKLFSHWLKTPLFRLHPLFYRERSQPPPFSCLLIAIKGRRNLPSTLRILPLKECSPPHLLALSRPFLCLLSDHEGKQPPLCTTTPQTWTPNSTRINGYSKNERNPSSPAHSPLLSLPPA